MALTRGQVVVMRRTGPAIVWWVGPSRVKVIPIIGYNGTPRHRADVRLSDPDEIAACAAGVRYPAVRCRYIFEVAVEAADAAKQLGSAPASLLQRMGQMISREAVSRDMEMGMHFGGPSSGFAPAVR